MYSFICEGSLQCFTLYILFQNVDHLYMYYNIVSLDEGTAETTVPLSFIVHCEY
jgi:hypothetical protein